MLVKKYQRKSMDKYFNLGLVRAKELNLKNTHAVWLYIESLNLSRNYFNDAFIAGLYSYVDEKNGQAAYENAGWTCHLFNRGFFK